MTRIAMVGGGPKCLFALLELHEKLRDNPFPKVEIDVYDPYPPGAGRVWNVAQPQELRINVRAEIIDASFSLGPYSFDQWRNDKLPLDSEDPFPPRALVGQYLHEQFERLAQGSPIKVEHRAFIVEEIKHLEAGWQVVTGRGVEMYDEIVLATGHGITGQKVAKSPSTILANALTVQRTELETTKIPAGSTVVVRGAALTAYDVVLALTEGTGGLWKTVPTPFGPILHYVPSGREPSRIIMTSRRGISMMPKPLAVDARVQETLETYRSKLRTWGNQEGRNIEQLSRILVHCALAIARINGVEVTEKTLRKTARLGISKQLSSATNPLEQMRYSLEGNRGVKPKTPEWIWGVVWSGLYSRLVEALSRIEWDLDSRQEFNLIAANFERMTFGPPEPTALKLLALYEAGLLSHELAGQHETFSHNWRGRITVDAVTISPGVLSAASPKGEPISALFQGLLDEGEVVVRAGERGILTDTDGTCINVYGQRNETLSALGRPTEDPTLGHDTLNRSLHPEYQRWAQRIADRVTNSNQKATL